MSLVRLHAAPAVALALVLALGVTPRRASAQLFPARSGESGLLDVPDAETAVPGYGLLGAELRVDRPTHGPVDAGPLPLYAVAGLARALEAGIGTREGGNPGDTRPARLVFDAALKLQLWQARPSRPAFAVDVVADRLNGSPVYTSRLIASTAAVGPFRVAAFGGGELGAARGLVYGGALSIAATAGSEVIFEALGGPRGSQLGAATRWRIRPGVGFQLGVAYLPGDGGVRASIGLGFGPTRREVRGAPAAEPEPEVAVAAATPEAVVYRDDRPRFRLKIHLAPDAAGEPRSVRHAPWTPALASAAERPAASGGVRGAVPSLDELAETQLREQEALADARERRARSVAEQLEGRERAGRDEVAQLVDRERELASREQQLEARERGLGRTATPTAQQRELESLEAQIAVAERTSAAEERSLSTAIEAAQGRERDATARQEAERAEATRLSASVTSATSARQQRDVRKQALGARNRQLAALEALLVARGERIDALERQLRVRALRLDAWRRRLDTRTERLDLLEKRGAGPASAAPPAAPPVGVGAGVPAPAASKDKAVFVMVVKSPTAIVKERPETGSAPAGGVIQPGAALERAVAAATVVTFASPTAELSELDREAVDNIAKLAAREGCELLIWARAKEPSLMSEAQRRASEIRTRVMSVAQLPAGQVVTRITTRPGAQGVDVVVSALREGARGGTAPAPAPATGATPAPTRAGQLEAGEAGKRQVREAVQAAQTSIEACVGDLMERRKLSRAEGTLKLTVSPAGKVLGVAASSGDLAGPGLVECLGAAAGRWSFPPSDAEYTVDVPITVLRGGAPR